VREVGRVGDQEYDVSGMKTYCYPEILVSRFRMKGKMTSHLSWLEVPCLEKVKAILKTMELEMWATKKRATARMEL